MLNNEFPPLGGGTGRVNLELLKVLAKNENLQIDLVTSEPEEGRKEKIDLFSDNINIYYVKASVTNNHHSNIFNLLLYSLNAFILARRLTSINGYSVCLSWCTLPAGFVGVLLKTLYKIRLVTRISGPDIPYFEKRYRFIYPVLTPILKLTWRYCDKLIVKCSYENEKLLNLGVVKSKINFIPNGVDNILFTPVGSKEVIKNQTFKLVYVARLVARKGQEMLIEVVGDLLKEGLDIELHLVGKGDEECNYKKLAGNLNLNKKIIFYGYVNHESLKEIYSMCHAFISASDAEGMSVAVLEALACGLPVVAPRDIGLNELVREGESGFLYDKGNKEGLKEKIKNLFSDSSIYNKFSAASRKISEEYSWKKAADLYLDILTEN